MKARASLLLFLALGLAPSPAGAQLLPGAQYDYKRFGFWTWYGAEDRSYSNTNMATVTFGVQHFAATGIWEIARGVDREDYVELGWRLERYSQSGRLIYEKNLYGLGIGSYGQHSLSPYFGLFARGGLLSQYYATPDITNVDYTNLVAASLQSVTASNLRPTAASNVRLSGGRFTLKMELGARWAPNGWFESRTSVSAYGGLDSQAATGSDAIPAVTFLYGFGVTQRVTFTIGLVQPYAEYRLGFLEHENNLLGSSRLALPVRQFFILGVMFRFSLLCFG
ncbi:MAG: hypothetical protein J0L75_16265 [Spirochaetes bacterium]|nr:hypothetical protein [Spirochaetota bacterium]